MEEITITVDEQPGFIMIELTQPNDDTPRHYNFRIPYGCFVSFSAHYPGFTCRQSGCIIQSNSTVKNHRYSITAIGESESDDD